ncbi:MAG: threonine--tRNA ligase [Propionibacteriaceae bacterium]|nr:threonine--tRNA ligase [Propionibacteriaceae bacterium]
MDVIVEGESQSVAEQATGLDLFGHDQTIVAMTVNGTTRDLATPLNAGDVVTAVVNTSPEGLSIIRHSAAHVAAQAVQLLRADAKLGIGPPITDGFYYDFDLAEPLTPEDLKTLEKSMQRIVKERQRFARRVVTDDQARTELATEPYKLELIADKGQASDADGSAVEVGGSELTIYDNLRRTGEVAWKDLCRGPHVPHTGYIKAFALTRSSAAYWRGDQRNASLQRLYGTAWASKEDVQSYQTRLDEAARRDHRKFGQELDLFSFPEEMGPGLPVFHPKGGVLKRIMEDYVRQRHIEEGFLYVGTPHVTKENLFHTSGHLPYFEDTMFPPMVYRDEDGQPVGERYFLKAMNCPMHNLIFKSRGRSYRELPLRFFEFGTVYRDERSGVLQGLTRVRALTQDDSHSYVMESQAADEVRHLLGFITSLLDDFGLTDYYLELSTRDETGAKDKFIGSDEQWAAATAVLEQVAQETGLDLVPDPGGAAFYGPKISVQAKDAIGRTWQMSTIQYDFNQPARFGLQYTAADGSHQQPVMIHSAKFGSFERFIGVLIEHYGGAFPVWLAPVQVVGIPISSDHVPYLRQVADRLSAAGVRVEVDDSDERMQKKIRTAQTQKVPYMMIAGQDDVDAGAVSFRYRDGRQNNGLPIDQALDEILTAIRERR